MSYDKNYGDEKQRSFPIEGLKSCGIGKRDDIFNRLAFKEGPPLSPWWEAHCDKQSNHKHTHTHSYHCYHLTTINGSSPHQTKVKKFEKEKARENDKSKQKGIIQMGKGKLSSTVTGNCMDFPCN